jgi:hypothetical protein
VEEVAVEVNELVPMVQPPQVSKELADWLKDNYGPRCYNPNRENEANHHRYAGMVDLAEYLVECYVQSVNTQTGLDADAEQATS